MNIPPEAIAEIARAVIAFGPVLLDLFTDDGREAVIEEIARNRDALKAAPDVLARIEAARDAARSRVRAHDQARSQTVRDSFRVAETTEGFARRLALSPTLTSEEKTEAGILHALAVAALDGRIEVAP